MRSVWALVRAHWLSRTSYRLQTLFGLAAVAVSVVPLFFIADALQPLTAEVIQGEGERYFGFVLVGTAAAYMVGVGVTALPSAVAAGIGRGTLEALVATPVSLPAILLGSIGSDLLWVGVRVVILLLAGWMLGGGLDLVALIPGLAILALVLAAYLPFGVVGAALVLVFRTSGPLPQGVMYVSILLGGVYYPTHVIPSWIQDFSAVIPLTYGLRALRRVVLGGATWDVIATDLATLVGLGAGSMVLATLVFSAAFRYARRAGTLAQY